MDDKLGELFGATRQAFVIKIDDPVMRRWLLEKVAKLEAQVRVAFGEVTDNKGLAAYQRLYKERGARIAQLEDKLGAIAVITESWYR